MNSYLTGKLPIPAISLKQRILQEIDPKEFWSKFFGPTFQYEKKFCCPLPEHSDSTPSFHVREDGFYKCFGCGKSGSNLIDFIAVSKNLNFEDALKFAFSKYCYKPIDLNKIHGYHKALEKDEGILSFLQETRGWSRDIIKHFRIGVYNNGAASYITFPQQNEYGFYVSVKYYDFLHKTDVKFWFEKDADNSPRIFGLEILKEAKKVYIFEGEPDCLLALSLGLPAITFGTAATWKENWRTYFSNLDIVICYDNDEAGIIGAQRVATGVYNVCSSLKIIKLPGEGLDFTDYINQESNSLASFKALEADTSSFKDTSEEIKVSNDLAKPSQIISTSLEQASLADYYGRPLEVLALVGGKEPSPGLLPREVRVLCQDRPNARKCGSCVLGDNPQQSKCWKLDPYHPDLLLWLTSGGKSLKPTILQTLGVESRKCKVDLKVDRYWNVEKALLTNPIEHGKLSDAPQKKIGFYFGFGLRANNHYRLSMYTVPHPGDNSAVHVITHAESIDTELDKFAIGEEEKKSLTAFQATMDLESWFNNLYDSYAKNVTRIWGRSLLHLAVDLPFFSPNAFEFEGELISRGGLDILIFGDPRCGKGKVAEGIANYYRFGEVMNGENVSLMNFIGGIESSDNYKGLRWGRFVANDRGIVIIDEASAIPIEVFGKLSRIRSEGVAELDKFGLHAKASASCSTIWIANPRESALSDYSYGVEAITGLIGQREDIARFDYTIAVATDEVDADTINQSYSKSADEYGATLHRLLVIWCKTRTKEQVLFTNEAVAAIYGFAKELGMLYCSDIPLVQAENIRIKIAKISAALAGRLYSTDSGGENLIVDLQHVQYAVKFLKQLYASPVLGYELWSRLKKRGDNFDPEKVKERIAAFLQGYPDIDPNGFYEFFLSSSQIILQDIIDNSGAMQNEVKEFVGDLVKLRCLVRKKFFYVKTKKFTQMLRKVFVL